MAAPTAAIDYQTPQHIQARDSRLDRKDHVWAPHKDGKGYKCLLCGAVCLDRPPRYPTSPEWMPDHYEVLTESERLASVGHTAY